MDTYLERYTDYLKNVKNMAKNSLAAYRRDISEFHHYLREQGISRPEEISGADISSYAFALKNSGRAVSTVQRKLASVRSYCAFLTTEGVFGENPANNIRTPRMEKKEIEYLSIEEVEALLSAPDDSVKGIRDRAILEMMYGTGIRVTEIASLKMEDVNFRIGFITCTGEFGKARIIPLGRPCREALERYLDESRPRLIEAHLKRKAEQRAAEDESGTAEPGGGEERRISHQEYIFMNFHGERLTRQGLWKIVRACAKQAGIEKKLTPQILRNSFAVHMVQNGADIKSIQELMGYEDATTAQIYLAVTKNRIKEVYDRTHPRA